MSWAIVLGKTQIRTLGAFLSVSATEQATSRLTGAHLATMKTLARLGLLEFFQCGASLADANSIVRVTPAGYRAWADVVEAARVNGHTWLSDHQAEETST